MNQIRCSQCGAVGLEPGFASDSGQGSHLSIRWVEGALRYGTFGMAKLRGRRRYEIAALSDSLDRDARNVGLV
nr:hypothetical protein [Streptomyces sp. 846.5]